MAMSPTRNAYSTRLAPRSVSTRHAHAKYLAIRTRFIQSPPRPVRAGLAADRRADGAELARRALAEEGDGHDADDRDQGYEQGVLDEAGAALVTTELRPHVRGTVLLPIGNDVHERSPNG